MLEILIAGVPLWYNSGENITIEFNGGLRDEQKPIEEIYLKNAYEKGGGIISIRCGGGKTVLALHIISILKKKTIVVVHKDFLMTQWRDRILEFLPDARIGKVQQDTIDIEGKAGTAIFMNCMTPHSSNQNRSPFPRRTLILSYRSSDAYPILI